MSEVYPQVPGGLPAGFGVGSRIAGYLLEEQIGAGGMAVVFRARDERLGRLVALKILAPALTSDAAFRQRFIRESRAAAAVDDPHIIPVLEAGEADGVLFIAMRYVPGGDVRALLHRRGPLPPERVAAIISPLASALDAAHAAGVVHRDVKPANVLMDSRPDRPDHVYLSDFGLSKGALSSVAMTATGQFLGTPDYTAPEQIQGQAVDGRADQYALACTAFELLAGEPPFQRDQALAVVYAHLSQPPPRLSALRPDLPAATDQVFATALAKSPADRYSSCREFADALRWAFGLAPYHGRSSAIPAHRPATQIAAPVSPAWDGTSGPGHAASSDTLAPQAAAAAGSWRARDSATWPEVSAEAGYQPLPRRPRRRWARAAGTLAAGTLAAVVAVTAVVLITHRPATSLPARSGPSSPAAASASPTGPPWLTYRDASGFSVKLPAGWAVSSRSAAGVRFTGPPGGFVVLIAWTTHPQADQLADWRQQAASKAAADPTYQQIRIQRVGYRGYDAADWEFTNVYQGVLTHVLDRGFIVRPGHLAYAIELYGPAAGWRPVFASLWTPLLSGFRPAG